MRTICSTHPAAHACGTFAMRYGTGTAYDYLYVEVWNSAGTSKLATLTTLSNKNAGTTWIRTTAGLLNTWKGQTVQIRFTATNDASNPTDFFVDDVAITNP